MPEYKNPGAKIGRVPEVGGNTANTTSPNKVTERGGNTSNAPAPKRTEITGGNYSPGQATDGKAIRQ